MGSTSERAELGALLAAAERTITQAVQEAGIDPEVAAAACAALAGEYTALAAAARLQDGAAEPRTPWRKSASIQRMPH